MSGLDNELLNRCFRFTAMGGGSSDEDDNSTTDSNEWSDAWNNREIEKLFIWKWIPSFINKLNIEKDKEQVFL